MLRRRCDVQVRDQGSRSSLCRSRSGQGAEASASLAGPPFRVGPLDGKGIGVVASRDIKAGELLSSEAPVVYWDSNDSWLTRSRSIQKQFDGLPPQTRDAVLELHDAHAVGGQKTLGGIVSTNSHTKKGTSAGVLCLECSRFNHSCVPNCEQSWNEDLQEVHIFASRDVRKGEELQIYYVDVRKSSEDRTSELLDKYRFCCDCPACTAADGASDRRRQRLLQLHHEVENAYGTAPQAGIQMAEEAMELFQEEGLHVNAWQKEMCAFAYQAAIISGNNLASRQWALRAHDFSRLCHGPEHDITLAFLRCAEDAAVGHRVAGG